MVKLSPSEVEILCRTMIETANSRKISLREIWRHNRESMRTRSEQCVWLRYGCQPK